MSNMSDCSSIETRCRRTDLAAEAPVDHFFPCLKTCSFFSLCPCSLMPTSYCRKQNRAHCSGFWKAFFLHYGT